jgi:hypothetical protein
VIRSIGVLETRQLPTEHAFVEVAVQERVGNVELMCRPVLHGDEREHGPNRRRFDDRGERFAEVQARALRVTAQDPPCLVLVECVVGVELGLEDPLAGDDACTGRTWDKSPRTVGLECIELLLHRCLPICVSECCVNR